MNRFRDNRGSIMVEFAICGILFIGFVLGMTALGLWKYNVSRVEQAARIAAYNVAVTNNPTEAKDQALEYMKNTLMACPTRGALAYCTPESGYGVAEAYMDPLFPGFNLLINPRGASTADGSSIHIRKEAVKVLEYRFRPENSQQFN